MPTQGYLGAFYGKVFPQVIDNCDVNWDAGIHGAPELDTGDKKEGSASVKIVVADAEAGDILATNVLTSMSLINYRRMQFWIKASKAIAAEDLALLIDETIACGGSPPEEVLLLPELAINTWTLVTLVLDTPADLDAVISVGLEFNANPGNCNIWIDDINAISSLVVTAEAVGTGDGSATEFDLDNPNIDLDTLVVYVDAVATRDFEVTPKGHIIFVTAPGDTLAITADYTYWVVENKGGFYNWAYAEVGDVAERTDFSSAGWKEFVGLLKGWTGTAEGFWLNEKWMAEVGNLLVIKFYDDEGNTKRYEGFAKITGISVVAAVSTLITQPISFQGHGVLARETT